MSGFPVVSLPVTGKVMSEETDFNFDGLDIEIARGIDLICGRFEAEWREGRQPRIEDYLGEVPDKGQPAFRAEMEALDRECASRRMRPRPAVRL